MAKIDKDFIVKNRFWLVLGGAALLLLVCWLWLLIGGSSAGTKQRDNYNTVWKAAMANADPKATVKNDAFQRPWRKYGADYAGQKDQVWSMAFENQKQVLTWPPDDSVSVWSKVLYPDDEVGPGPNEARKHYKDVYAKQFDGLEKLVAPAEFNGGDEGFKQIVGPTVTAGGAGGGSMFPGGGPSNGPRPPMRSGKGGVAPGGGDSRPGGPGAGGAGAAPGGGAAFDTLWASKDAVPTMEEIWLCQEDLWVKREMLRIIRDALDTYATFKPVEIPKDEPMPDKIVSRHRFRNLTWEVTLLIESTKEKGRRTVSAHSTIKNVSGSKRPELVANPRTGLGLKFELTQNDNSVPFDIAGEPLPYGSSTEFGRPTTFDTIDFDSAFGLKQVLEWATSPIRRIDELRTATNSNRLASQPLTYNKALYTPPKEDPDAVKSEPTPGGPPVSGAGAGPPGGIPGAGGTPNANLERNRYLLTNDQCRHLPIAMVLVVDQAAVNDVLVAVANSPLRVQITQVNLIHVHDPGPQQGDAMGPPAPPSGSPPRRPGGAGVPGFEKSGPPPGKFGPGKTPPGLFPGGPGGNTGSESEGAAEDNNLFELSVYGVATLYERFPKKKVEEPKPDAAK